MKCAICRSEDEPRKLFHSRDLHFGLPGEFEFSECSACGVWRLSPQPEGEELKKYYPEKEYYAPFIPELKKGLRYHLKQLALRYYGYGVRRGGLLAAWLRYKAPNYPFRGGQLLLDVGCGQGYFLRSVRDLGWDVLGIDMSQRAVEECRSQGLEAKKGELKEMGFPDNSFDAVHLFHVFEHLPEPAAFVDEVFRILRPGGEIILTVPNNRSFCARVFGKNWFSLETPRHLFIYNRKNLHMLLSAHGFEVKDIITSDFLGSLHSSLEYALGRKLPNFRPIVYAVSVIVEPIADLFGWGDQVTARAVKK